jgi:hypothetical protein
MQQLGEHAEGSALLDLAQATINGELFVRHTHVGLKQQHALEQVLPGVWEIARLVCLHIGLRDGLQLGSRHSVQKAVHKHQLEEIFVNE